MFTNTLLRRALKELLVAHTLIELSRDDKLAKPITTAGIMVESEDSKGHPNARVPMLNLQNGSQSSYEV